MNPYTVRFPNGEMHGASTLTAALKRAARATREGRPAPSVYKAGRKLATCQLDYKAHRGPDRRRRPVYGGAQVVLHARPCAAVAVCTLLKAGKAELRRTRR